MGLLWSKLCIEHLRIHPSNLLDLTLWWGVWDLESFFLWKTISKLYLSIKILKFNFLWLNFFMFWMSQISDRNFWRNFFSVEFFYVLQTLAHENYRFLPKATRGLFSGCGSFWEIAVFCETAKWKMKNPKTARTQKQPVG